VHQYRLLPNQGLVEEEEEEEELTGEHLAKCRPGSLTS